MYDYHEPLEQMLSASMLHKILELDRIGDKFYVLLKLSCYVFYQHRWYSYLTKLDVLQI